VRRKIQWINSEECIAIIDAHAVSFVIIYVEEAMKSDDSGTIDRWADLFQVLSDRHRVTILSMLNGGVEKSVSEFGDVLQQTQPAVSHHLAMLKDAGLITFRRDGRFNRYSIVPGGMAAALERVVGSPLPATVTFGGLEIRLTRVV
jgi:DNA-binding transcriptional ArsR family regulator